MSKSTSTTKVLTLSLQPRLATYIASQAIKNNTPKATYIKQLIEQDYYKRTNIIELPKGCLNLNIDSIDSDSNTIKVSLPEELYSVVDVDSLTISLC